MDLGKFGTISSQTFGPLKERCMLEDWKQRMVANWFMFVGLQMFELEIKKLEQTNLKHFRLKSSEFYHFSEFESIYWFDLHRHCLNLNLKTVFHFDLLLDVLKLFIQFISHLICWTFGIHVSWKFDFCQHCNVIFVVHQ